jgi:hypothetical protein
LTPYFLEQPEPFEAWTLATDPNVTRGAAHSGPVMISECQALGWATPPAAKVSLNNDRVSQVTTLFFIATVTSFCYRYGQANLFS